MLNKTEETKIRKKITEIVDNLLDKKEDCRGETIDTLVSMVRGEMITSIPELYTQYLELEAKLEKKQQEKDDYFGCLGKKYQNGIPEKHQKVSQIILDEYYNLVVKKEESTEEIYNLLNNTIYLLENGKLLVGYINGDKPTIEERELYEQKLNHGKTL